MRVIAGHAHGRRLKAPRGLTTRPTSARARESIFSRLQVLIDFDGISVLDVFAGSGSLGCEALSRGAARAVFVESDPSAFDALRRNIAALRLARQTRVVRGDVGRMLGMLAAQAERFELVFLDPPYGAGLVDATLARLGEGALTEPAAIVVAQHFTKQPPAETIGALRAFRARRFGETTLTFFRAGAYDAGASGGD